MKIIVQLQKLFLTPLGKRMSRDERNQSRGVALILVMVSIAFMSSIVVDLGYNEHVRFKLAIRTRDSIKAEALAAGALNWGRLFLVIQDKLQSKIAGFSLPVDTVWQVPLSSEMLKGFINGSIASSLGLDVGNAVAAQGDKKNPSGRVGGGFGNFEGSFSVAFVDEESKISLDFGAPTDTARRATTRKLLASLISPKRYDVLFEGNDGSATRENRASIVANIHDYVDANETRTDPYDLSNEWGRSGTASEKDIYRNDKGILPKNAFFDSLGEVKQVHGITDEFEQAFFDSLTIYTQGGKINILSAKDQVIEAIMRFCALNDGDPLFEKLTFADEMIRSWRDYGLNKEGPVSVEGFTSFLEKQGLKVDKKRCEDILDVKSKNFTMTAKATVGTGPNSVTRTLTLVTRVVGIVEDKYYFRSR